AVASLLTGPRTYLVLAANNAEMRAGSGMFLSIGELTTSAGSLRLTGMSSVTEVPIPPGVPVEGDLASRWGFIDPAADWRDLMLSPRFDASAQLATRMWAAAGRGPVDGVLVLDPVALSGILQATGPVQVGPRPIGRFRVVPEL